MLSLGSTPLRALNTFGVAGVLSAQCEVVFSTVFNTRHLGQVTDLLVARLRGMGADELRFRMVLALAVFDAYKGQTSEKTDTSHNLSDPLHLECGFDEERVALAIRFILPQEFSVDFEKLPEKIKSGSAESYFETLISELYNNSHRLVLKYQPSTRKVEILSLFALVGKVDPVVVREKGDLLVIYPEEQAQSPESSLYTELGDLDYANLLRDEKNNAQEGENFKTFAQTAAEAEEKIIVKGKKENGLQSKTVISGVTQKIEEKEFRIKGGSGDAVDQTVLKVSGGAYKDLEAYKDKIKELELKIKELERQGQGTAVPSEAAEDSSIGGLFKKVFSFNKEQTEEKEQDTEVGEEEELEEVITPATVVETPSDPESNVEAVATSLMVEIQQGALSHTLTKAQEESAEIQKELGSNKAKKWVDGLMTDLVQERAKLQDMARKVNLSIRKKEHEFKNKELVLQDEIRRRDEMIRQKTNTLNRTKEQVTQLTAAIDRLKATSQSSQDDMQSKQKLEITKKVLEKVKEDNARLQDRVDELKGQLANAQISKQKNVPAKGELTALQGNNERLQKQIDEFKKANQQLVEKLDKVKKERYTEKDANTDELKKRLEGAMKIVTVSKKENEKLLLKVEELQREEIRLKMELNRANAILKGKSGKPPSDSGSENPSSAA